MTATLQSWPAETVKKILSLCIHVTCTLLWNILLVLWVHTYQNTWCPTPKEHLNIHCHEKLNYQNAGWCYNPCEERFSQMCRWSFKPSGMLVPCCSVLRIVVSSTPVLRSPKTVAPEEQGTTALENSRTTCIKTYQKSWIFNPQWCSNGSNVNRHTNKIYTNSEPCKLMRIILIILLM